MHSRNVEIKSPCHESWDAMHGDEARRFCDVCAKHVHNLSAMSRQDATDLLQEHKGQHLCVRYANDDDGRIAFNDAPVVPVNRLRVARTAFAAVMLAACTPYGDGPPIQDLGDIAIDTMARDARPSPEGGCEVQTGPFTTLHFPRGHEVCRDLPDLGARLVTPPPLPEPQEIMMGEAPMEPEPPPPALMGKMAPLPEPEIEMGAAVPDLKEPCDPPPAVAPPSPLMGQAPVNVEPPSQRMGDIAGPAIVEPPAPPTPAVKQPHKMGRRVIERPEKTAGPRMGDIE